MSTSRGGGSCSGVRSASDIDRTRMIAAAKGGARSDYAYPDARLLVFCKAPEAGQVKTRLIPAVGELGALAVYDRLAAHVIERAVEARLAPVQLWISGCTDHPFFSRWSADRHAQQGGDLGERMSSAIRAAFAEPGVRRVVLFGTDIPGITSGYLQHAVASLDHFDAVLGPAEDGGYVLIGVKRADASLFDGVPWSTSKVLRTTRNRIAALGWRWEEMEMLWDVDEPADLARLRAFERALLG